MSSSSTTTKQNPSTHEIDLEGGTGCVPTVGGLVDGAARVLPNPAPLSSNAFGPEFKDQVRTVRPLVVQGNGKPAAAAFKQGGEEQDNTLAARDRPPPRYQEPQGLGGGYGQVPSVVAFAEGIPIDGDTEALASGRGVANQQMMVLRKHRIWAVAAVVLGLGTVLAVVVAVVLTNNNNTPSPGEVNTPMIPPPNLTPPVTAPSPTSMVPMESPTTVSTSPPGTIPPTPIPTESLPTESPPTVAPVPTPTTVAPMDPPFTGLPIPPGTQVPTSLPTELPIDIVPPLGNHANSE